MSRRLLIAGGFLALAIWVWIIVGLILSVS